MISDTQINTTTKDSQAILDTRINTYTNSDQTDPSVATLNDGGFVVTWTSNGQDGFGHNIYGQRYDANGNTHGAEFRVTSTTGIQLYPSVAELTGGGFIVIWQYSIVGRYSYYGQRFDSSGQMQGTEFRINSQETVFSSYPAAVTTLTDGGFVILGSGSDNSVFGQRYGANGNMQGAEFFPNTYTAGSQSSPSVVALTGGGFVVTWTSGGQDGSGGGIYGQRYEASGVPQGAEFRINSYTKDDQHCLVEENFTGNCVAK